MFVYLQHLYPIAFIIVVAVSSIIFETRNVYVIYLFRLHGLCSVVNIQTPPSKISQNVFAVMCFLPSLRSLQGTGLNIVSTDTTACHLLTQNIGWCRSGHL